MAGARTRDPDPASPAPPFRLVTLGDLALLHPDGRTALGPSKQLALLVYLQCAERRTATRLELLRLLWADDDLLASERSALRTALSRLRGVLGAAGLATRREEITLTAAIECDRDLFLAAVRRGEPAAALELYRGPFFEFGAPGARDLELWAEGERVRLSRAFLTACETLATAARDAGRPLEAVRVARFARERVRDAELPWRLLIEALTQSGARAEALAEADAFERWIQADGRPPEAATAAAIARVRGSHWPAAPSAPGSSELQPELVGRTREFGALLQAWRTAQGGAPRRLALEAPPGFGKTRLLAEFAARLNAEGARLVRLQARLGERTVAFALASRLAGAVGRLPGASGVARAYVPALRWLEPALGDVFGGHAPPAQTPPPHHMQQALADLLTAVAENRPTAILIDDLHWIDEASYRLLAAVASSADQLPLLIVTAARPRSGAATLAGFDCLELPPLSEGEVEDLLASIADLPGDRWAATLSAGLHRAAGGSPLHVIELRRLALDRGNLAVADHQWSCPSPEWIRTGLAAANPLVDRLQGLDPVTTRTIEILAAAGAPLQREGLTALTGVTDLADRLQDAERRGFLALEGDTYTLTHDEVGRLALEAAGPDRGRVVHGAIGRYLAALPDPTPARLRRAAVHLAQAGDERGLAALLRQHVTAARRRGRRTGAGHLAGELLGGLLPDEGIDRLVRRLPLHLRMPARSVPVAAAAALILAAGAISVRTLATPPPPIDAYLIAATGDPESDTLALLRVPVSAGRLADGDSLTLAGARSVGAWHGTRELYGAEPVASPSGDRIAYVRATADGGALDLFVREPDGSVSRLASAPGDDIDPSWSPDGRAIVFATARWSPPEVHRTDLAVIDLSSAAVRRLTSGDGSTVRPLWSPDGTRIAFVHQRAPEDPALCWITAHGAPGRCYPQGSRPVVPIGWRDREHVVVVPTADPDILLWNVDTGGAQVLVSPERLGTGILDPRRRWLIHARLDGVRRTASLYDLATPGRRWPLASMPLETRLFWSGETGPRDDFLHEVRVELPPGGLPLGIPTYLRASGVSAAGGALPIPDAVLTWWSRDTAVATVTPLGAVRLRGPGAAWIGVTAGGWRTDSVRIQARQPTNALLFEEDWRDPALGGWLFQGNPVPVTRIGPGGTPGLLVNGDQTFESGAYTRAGFDPNGGLVLVARVSAPLRDVKWQRLMVALFASPRPIQSGFASTGACSIRIPAGEGDSAASRIGLGDTGSGGTLPLPPPLLAGDWHTIIVQVFPDGTCGFAIDGTPVWRSTVPRVTSDMHVVILGQSVGTNMMVGPLTLWRGITTEVDWDDMEPAPLSTAGIAGRSDAPAERPRKAPPAPARSASRWRTTP